VRVSRAPRGISVAVSISRIESLRLPDRPAVLMPPSLTTIWEPFRGSAVSTATSRDQPPVRRAVSCTVGVLCRGLRVGGADLLGVARDRAARPHRSPRAGETVVAGKRDREPPRGG